MQKKNEIDELYKEWIGFNKHNEDDIEDVKNAFKEKWVGDAVLGFSIFVAEATEKRVLQPLQKALAENGDDIEQSLHNARICLEQKGKYNFDKDFQEIDRHLKYALLYVRKQKEWLEQKLVRTDVLPPHAEPKVEGLK